LWGDFAKAIAFNFPKVALNAASFHHEGMEMVSVRDLDAALAEADCAVIATDHSVVDWGEIARVASLVVDTRRVV